MFRAHVLIVRRGKLYYTVSGIITPIGVYYTVSGIITPIGVYYTVSGIITPIYSLWYHHTYRCDDTRDCIIQFCPPVNEHMCSKHVEA